MDLVLASQSPRRSELLRIAGFTFRVRSRPVEEVRGEGESPLEYVLRLARAKAEAAWEGHDEAVLGADTIVVLGGQVLEKPADAADARRMIAALSGRSHTVVTGICLRHRRGAILDTESTHVHFTTLEPTEIDAYVASGEPMDKAGGYGIQGLASKFIDRIEGCYFNVMGLPLARFYTHWKSLESGA
ncbi:MAG TPA: Maf family protein [Bryobacteraceae bacterium]|jgi:septum formation protein